RNHAGHHGRGEGSGAASIKRPMKNLPRPRIRSNAMINRLRCSMVVVMAAFVVNGAVNVQASSADRPATSLLRWNFYAGERLRVRYEQRSEENSATAGKQSTRTKDLLLQFLWELQRIDEKGNAEFVLKIERARWFLNNPD